MKRKTIIGMALLCLGMIILSSGGCGKAEGKEPAAIDKDLSEQENDSEMLPGEGKEESKVPAQEKEETDSEIPEKEITDATGKTLDTRIRVPDGYKRVKAKEDSFASFLRNYKMKKDKSPVLLYDRRKKGNQNAHVAVFKLPIENEDLQQCADSVMRVYAEYYWQKEEYDKIAFHFVDGFLAEYKKWRQGYRIQVTDGGTTWVKTESADNSYETFKKYLRMVFAYAGTLSMENESKKIKLSAIQAGDIFIKGASPGHVVMVVDVCKDENGKKAFLLAQGYMPAQEFHVLKNPMHEEDPWYYEEEMQYPFVTPEYTFDKGSLRRPDY